MESLSNPNMNSSPRATTASVLAEVDPQVRTTGTFLPRESSPASEANLAPPTTSPGIESLNFNVRRAGYDDSCTLKKETPEIEAPMEPARSGPEVSALAQKHQQYRPGGTRSLWDLGKMHLASLVPCHTLWGSTSVLPSVGLSWNVERGGTGGVDAVVAITTSLEAISKIMGAIDTVLENTSLAQWAMVGCGLLFAYALWSVIYNLYFHPLARYPGPLLAKISPVYSIWGLFRGRWPFDVHQLHLKYGPVLRLMPNELAFTDPEGWRDIYGHRQGHPQFHKDPIHVGSVQDIPGSTTLTMADDNNHSRQRRTLAHAFSQKALLEQEPIIRGYVDLFVDRLKSLSKSARPVNMCDYFNYTTFDIIGDMAFGEPFGCLRDNQMHSWVNLITQTIKAGAYEQATRRMAETGSVLQNALLSFVPKALKEKRYRHLELSREKCLKRIKEGLRREHRDFLYYILRQNEKGGVSQDEIILNSALFIVAGSETTASLLSGMLMWLMRTPHAYARLASEIRSRFATAESMHFLDLQECEYMNACIDEALRIFPPVPTGLTRTVPAGGDTVAGEFLPGGTTVSVYGWAAAHSPSNFYRPDEFLPERWIASGEYLGQIIPEAHMFPADKKDASQPFSLGPRACIGKHLSYLELRLILGSLIWHFDIERSDLDDGQDVWDPAGDLSQIKAFNTWNKPPLMCRLTQVKR
ncbi:benzoate 4-monooxygenase cytochrome P450 [Zalerion maritima]|uniref:Benzoate 4-monooxygenase cytochrome P450 n=1 Tax=Zalerion maritima TaxID=339359 RepID=A0AAD5RTC1_9PEZI|nr:benzoate 4-monooxygenase cytochrome P450 [Zalerion maritima]